MAEHIGARIAYWRRRRGLTQGVLAGLAGVSQAYISQVEVGRKGIERRSTLVAIAAALQVTVTDLVGEPGDPTDPLKAATSSAIPRIRVALVEIEEGMERTPTRPLEQLEADVRRMAGLRAISDYPTMARELADLLGDAAAYGGLPLARIGYETSVCLRNLGYRDLALPAARVAVAAAAAAGDPAWIGATKFVHSLALPIEAARTARRVVDRSLAELQAHAADQRVRQMLGQLHLSASLACAVDKRPDDAAAHIAAAEAEARTLGDPDDGIGFNLSAFGPTNLGLWRMSVDVELGEHGRALETAPSVNPAGLKVANRHQSYWLSYGRALAHSGRTDREALTAFTRAERAAPAPFSLNPMARDAVSSMVHRARHRSVSEDLRILARRVGVDVAR